MLLKKIAVSSKKTVYFILMFIFFHSSNLEAQSYTQSGGTATRTNQTYTASNTDQSGVLVTNNGIFTLSSSTVSTTGNTSSGDNSSFYGLNAGVLANSGAKITLNNCNIKTTGIGANGVFAYGTASISMTDDTVYCTGRLGHAIMCSGGGTITAKNVVMTTTNQNSGAIATDRGSGTITVTGGSVLTTGKDSPGIYSTGTISVSDATITSTGSEAAVIEGRNNVTLSNVTLSGGIYNYGGVLVVQTMSGDSETGTANFVMTGGSFTIPHGPLFFVTNTDALVTLTNVSLSIVSDTLINACGTSRWGTSGSNGGDITFTANTQILSGKVVLDNISTIAMKLQSSTTYTGSINSSNSSGTTGLTMDASSKWILTGNSYLSTITNSAGVSGTSVTNITGNGYNIYYNSALSGNNYLGAKTYRLVNGGYLVPKDSAIKVTDTPKLVISRQTISFGNITNGEVKIDTIVVKNNGTADLIISAKSITGTDSSMFKIISGGNAKTLVSGGSEVLTIQVTGAMPLNSRTAKLIIVSNDPDNPNFEVTLNANIQTGLLTVPVSFNFNSVPINNSKDSILALTNNGNLPVTVSGITIGGSSSSEFSLVGISFPFTVSAGSTQSVTIRCQPVVIGLRNANLLINSNDPANPQLTIALSGLGYSSQFTISGVITVDNSALSGVKVNLTGSKIDSFFTGSDGSYSFAVASGGSYTVSPSKSGYTFLPENKSITNISGNILQNFTAVLCKCIISGKITKGSSALSNVKIMLTGTSIDSVYSGSDGSYTLQAVYGGSYTITPLKSYYTFSPVSKNFLNISGNQIQNFSSALNNYTISGFVYYNGSVLENVNMKLTGSSNQNTNTGSNGFYSFSLDALGDYVLTPYLSGYLFSPSAKTFSGLSKNEELNISAINNSPSQISLLSPDNNQIISVTYPVLPIVFKWRKSLDPEGLPLKYNLNITGGSLNKIYENIVDTLYSLDLMNSLSLNTLYSWYIETSDGINITKSEINTFRTSSSTTDVEKISITPVSYDLSQNYPNPFNPETVIKYSISENIFVSIKVYNTVGKEVALLVNGNQNAGTYQITWHPKNEPSGVYYYKISAGNFKDVRKMVYMR